MYEREASTPFQPSSVLTSRSTRSGIWSAVKYGGYSGDDVNSRFRPT